MHDFAAKSRLDWLVLILVSLYVLVTLTWRGLHQNIAFDESWHIYFGSVSPLWKAIQEWARDTHPPLCSFLLRPLVAFDTDPIWPRLLSIVPAAIQPILWFGILRKLGVHRALAYAGVVLLATSHTFSDLGVVIRGYSLASMCGMAAAYFLLDAFPSSEPNRRSIALGMVFAAIAFASEYPAGMALTALAGGLVLIALFDREFARAVTRNLAAHSRWPERTFAVLGISAVVAFYGVTYAMRELVNTVEWFPEAGESYIGFAADGLVRVLHYFTPIDVRDLSFGPAVAGVWLAAVALLGVLLAKRSSPLSRRRAVVMFGLVILVVATAALGILRKYPWGGEVRHQYMFVPLLHATFILALDEAVRGVTRQRWVPIVTALVTVAAGLVVTIDSRAHFDTNERQGDSVLWAEEACTVFPSDETTTVMLPNCSLIGLFGTHRAELDLRFVKSIGRWDLFRGGKPVRDMIRPRYLWSLDAIPQPFALDELRAICDRLEIDAVRIFTSRFDWVSVEARREMGADVAARAAKAGFKLSERRVWAFGETMRLDRVD